jgi:hypothetical protein
VKTTVESGGDSMRGVSGESAFYFGIVYDFVCVFFFRLQTTPLQITPRARKSQGDTPIKPKLFYSVLWKISLDNIASMV